ncbi:MAG: hypothetical protein WHT06_07510 [Desulfobacterales bacterium]
MDDLAARLLEELGGPSSPEESGRTPGTGGEGVEAVQVLLIEAVYLLNACFREVLYWEGRRSEKDSFLQLVSVLQQLGRVAGEGGLLRIRRLRPVAGPGGPRPDLSVQIGDLQLDGSQVLALIRRAGIRLKHLEGRFFKAAELLTAEGWDTIEIRLPGEEPEALEGLRAAVRILSAHRQAAERGAPILYPRDGRMHQVLPVTDDQGRPDPNLTLLAAENGLSPEAMKAIVARVGGLLKRPEGAALRRQTPDVYRALFALRRLRASLKRPPIEIGIDRSPAGGSEAVPAGGAAPPAGTEKRAAQPPPEAGAGGVGAAAGTPPSAGGAVADIAAGLAAFFQRLPEGHRVAAQKAADGLLRNDYVRLDPERLGERLEDIGRLVHALETRPAAAPLLESVLRRLEENLGQLSGETLGDLTVSGTRLKLWREGGERDLGQVSEPVARALDTAKDRVAARRRLREVAGEGPLYLARDAGALASFFAVPVEEMEAILRLFRSCFDARGSFQRLLFEKRVPELARYPRKVFAVLWEFLKDMPHRSDRLPFLNSLQLMIKEIRQPLQALKIVLTDFVGEPERIQYPDRNALMLAIQFLRRYNKEINVDIELTPEEILRVRDGLDEKTVAYALWKVNNESRRFLAKALAIRKTLGAALDPATAPIAALPARFLLALEREQHIFLSLTGGDKAASILHAALAVYGQADAAAHRLAAALALQAGLLQHLSVLIRGLGRVGGESDLLLLDRLRSQERPFLDNAPDARTAALVRRVFGWIEPAKQEIRARLCGAPPPSAKLGSSNVLSSTNTIDL